VRLVSPRGDRIPIDAMVSRIDARTRVVTASTVTFAPGFRTEVDRLGRACRERGVFFMVDAAQSCGVLSTDVAASQIDGLAVLRPRKVCWGSTAWASSIVPVPGGTDAAGLSGAFQRPM